MAHTKVFAGLPMRALYSHKLKQKTEGKLEKGRKADRAPCLAVEQLEAIAQFKECFGHSQTYNARNWVEPEQISPILKNLD